MEVEDTQPDERGVLAAAFWHVLERRLAEPRFAAIADQPELASAISDATGPILENLSVSVLDSILEGAPDVLAANKEYRLGFEARLGQLWGKSLDLLHLFYGLCVEAGDSFNRRYGDRAITDEDYSCQAIIRLHARSCLVASEVLALLRSGHASGAHARWRTLHELAVVAVFLREQDDEVAHRYLLHDNIQAYKSALSHRTYAQRLGHEPLDDEEFEAITTYRDELVAKYGSDFGNDYGWAASLVPGHGRTFVEIELAVDLDHMRPYYKMASHAIHPNARGLFFDLGVGEDENLMLAGPSTRGLADPAMGTCTALYQTTVTLLNERTDVDEVVIMLVLQRLVPQIEEALLEADAAHDAEADRLRAEVTGAEAV